MSSSEEHHGAVAAAKEVVGQVQELIAAITEKLDNEVIPAVHHATGGLECNMESGRMAFSWTAGLKSDADELYRRTENIVAELDRYDGGF